jgi:hypothetical protein
MTDPITTDPLTITVNGVAHTFEVSVIPEPEVRATPIAVRVEYTRNFTLKGKPVYKIVVDGEVREIAMPQSANTMVKAFLSANGRAHKAGEREPWELYLRYARGTWVNAAGEAPRSFTWEYLNEWTDPSDRFPEGQQKKIKIWGGLAPQVDSILVRATERDQDGTPVLVLSGHWVDGTYETGGRWSPAGGPELMDWTSGLAKALPGA